MRGFTHVLAAAVVFAAAQAAFASAKIDGRLRDFGEGRTGHRYARVLALLDARPQEGTRVPRKYDTRNVVGFLRSSAAQNFDKVQNFLESEGAFPGAVKPLRIHWINSTITCQVTPEGLKILAQAPGVLKIYSDAALGWDPPRRSRNNSFRSFRDSDEGKMPYDLVDMQWDKLIQEHPELTGKGVVLGHVDTGVDGKHPALQGKIRVYFNAEKKTRTEPIDSDAHGTHTAGTMVGTGKDGVPMGLAPGAELVAAGPLSSYDGMLTAMEFMLDPDGNPSTRDLPRAVNNSWNCRGAPDLELFYRAISAWEAAGILPVFSAGNTGPDKGTITPPHEHPGVIAVGSTGPNGQISSFSSRGPGVYRGQNTQKPDLTAPGENILSSVPGGKYDKYDGTSMASPHIAGATAILFQIDPQLTPNQVKDLLIRTATPLDENGQPGKAGEWNANYGFGKSNIYAAAKMAMDMARTRAGAPGQGLLGNLLGNLDLQSPWLESPHATDVRLALAQAPASAGEVFEFPSAFEHQDSWLNAAELSN